MNLFVKYKCGCIGLHPCANGEGNPIIIKPCDYDRCDDTKSLFFWKRKIESYNEYEVLPEQKQIEIMQEIQKNFRQADAWRDLIKNIRIVGE